MAIGNQAQVPSTAKRRVLTDLASAMAEQARIASETAKSVKVQAVKAHDGSPYKSPEMGGFTATKGKYAGQFMHRLVFPHKANPAWSRQYDATDLELILANLDTAKAALIVLRQNKPKEAKA